MEQLSNLKAILHSKRANIFYLEYCRILQKDGRVLYLSEDNKQNLYFNIPIANTSVILLGNGTSITQAAVRMLSQAGVLIGFCGGGSTPLYMANDVEQPVEWFTPHSEYRPTQYLQAWLSFWFNDASRLTVAKDLMQRRLNFLIQVWSKDKDLKAEGIELDQLAPAIDACRAKIAAATSVKNVLATEAQFAKQLYKYIAQLFSMSFTRQYDGTDKANSFLNHGNYLAYGSAASVLWVLGIPHGFAVMHGKTRRGALVFDIADLIKDALVLPWAFICAKEKTTEQEFRQQILQVFARHNALEFMFNQVKDITEHVGKLKGDTLGEISAII